MNGSSKCLSKTTRIHLCDKLGPVYERRHDDYIGTRIVRLGEHAEMGCKSVLELGGGGVGFPEITSS